MRWLALALIRLYQRHLSPHKGFHCAYRVHTGRASCSALGWRAVRRHGILGGLVLIRARTRLCGVAHRRWGSARAATRARALHAQRGVCDAGCDLPLDAHCHSPCDAPCDGSCDSPGGPSGPAGRWLSSACDLVDCCSCDWPSRNKDNKRSKQESTIHLPPRRLDS